MSYHLVLWSDTSALTCCVMQHDALLWYVRLSS